VCGWPLGSIGIFKLAEDLRDRHDRTRLSAPYTHPCRYHYPRGKRLRTTNSALKGTLAFVALTLVLAVVLASGGGGRGEGGSSAGRGPSNTGKATSSGKSTTGAPSGGGGRYGSSSSAATTTTNGASGGTLNTIVIKETEMKLSPSTVTLSKPGTYAFKAENKGSTQHSLRSMARA
jgi:hypothetical protein